MKLLLIILLLFTVYFTCLAFYMIFLENKNEIKINAKVVSIDKSIDLSPTINFSYVYNNKTYNGFEINSDKSIKVGDLYPITIDKTNPQDYKTKSSESLINIFGNMILYIVIFCAIFFLLCFYFVNKYYNNKINV
jgi:hypothetical protein